MTRPLHIIEADSRSYELSTDARVEDMIRQISAAIRERTLNNYPGNNYPASVR